MGARVFGCEGAIWDVIFDGNGAAAVVGSQRDRN